MSTPAFEGPIDLLLHLVSSHEVDVLDVPLMPVVDAFVRILSDERDLIDFNQLSEFLLVAAILIELKSQRLLPGPENVEDDEELAGWEERDLLLARLLECRAYAAAADVFVALAEQAARSRAPRGGPRRRLRGPRPRPAGRGHRRGPGPGLPAGLGRAAGAPGRPLPRHGGHGLGVRDGGRAHGPARDGPAAGSFRQLVAECQTRMEVIVRFLALLELCKMGRVALGQGQTFGDLQIAWLARDELAGVSSGRGLAEMGGFEVDDYEG